MNGKTLFIRRVTRSPRFGDEDVIAFEKGVNVIVGPPNTGKSKWLRMIDYLFGDDGKPEDVFGEDLSTKYESVRMDVSIGEEDLTIERHWKKQGVLTKVFVNEKPLGREEYCDFLMELLQIPTVNYPQGNPYGPRTWPVLGWRSLFRHIYRRQEFWGDLADKQPKSEQHACLLQFLGLARILFSGEYGKLVQKEKKLGELQLMKQQFLQLLQEVSREIVSEKELGVAITPESLKASTTRIHGEIEALSTRRAEILTSVLDQATGAHGESGESPTTDFVQELSQRLVTSQDEQGKILSATRIAESRLDELRRDKKLAEDEQRRLQRAVEAGEVLLPLRVTHCPACDRELKRQDSNDGSCYVCGRPLYGGRGVDQSALKRLDFEMEQLNGELEETAELLRSVETEYQELQKSAKTIALKIRETQELLRPVRKASAAILPPELSAVDIQIGRLQERLKQLERIGLTLERRSQLSSQITQIQKEVLALQDDVNSGHRSIDYEGAADMLADGMNSYLNQIKELNPKSWTQESVGVQLSDRETTIRVGRSRWDTKLGGTLTLYFLIAYHYAMMQLSAFGGRNYPGFCMLDFPAELEDGSSVADKENFVLEPFIASFSRSTAASAQIIVAGSSFEKLAGAHRIELSRIWN